MSKKANSDAHRYSFVGEPLPRQTLSIEDYPLKHGDFCKLNDKKAAIIMRILQKIEHIQRQAYNLPLHSETNSMPGPLQLSPAPAPPKPTSSANGSCPDLSPKSKNEGSRKTAAELNAWQLRHSGTDLGDYSSKGKFGKLVIGLKVFLQGLQSDRGSLWDQQ